MVDGASNQVNTQLRSNAPSLTESNKCQKWSSAGQVGGRPN